MSEKKAQTTPEQRSLEIEYEVPGTPEQIWQAIATGPGITSWLCPTEVEEHVGGAVAFHMGPGIESSGTVTAWEPPRWFAYEEPEWAPGAPPLGTEFIIETRTGGTCVVRLVHSLFTSSDAWDDQFEDFETGWAAHFQVLRLYITHFFGQPCSGFRAMAIAPGSESEAWDVVTGALGLADAAKGQPWSSRASGTPPLAGVVESAGEGRHLHEVILRLDEPAPGIALIGAHTWGGKAHATLGCYFYGEEAAGVVARDEALWSAWLSEHFPPPAADV